MDVIKSCELTTLVPHVTPFNLVPQIIRNEPGPSSPFSDVLERKTLYYDEHVDVYVVLSSPYHNEEQFRRLLSRVSITLEAYAAATRPWPNTDRRHDPSSTVLKDLIYRETCGGLDESLLVFGQDRADGDDKNLVSLSAAWRFTVLLGRTSSQHHDSFITLVASANPRAVGSLHAAAEATDLLPSLAPAGINLLESFHSDPALGRSKPYLSATRVSRVVPATHLSAKPQRIESIPWQAYRAAPAAQLQIRYSKVEMFTKEPSLLATLEFEVTPFAECDVELEELTLRLEDGEVTPLVYPDPGLLPLTCRFGDWVTFVYRLAPQDALIQAPRRYSNFRSLEVFLNLRAVVSSNCRAPIRMKRMTSVDLTAAVHPSASEPGQVTLGSIIQTGPTQRAGSTEAHSGWGSSGLQHRSQESNEIGVFVTISGPSEVCLGQIFPWHVIVVNRSAVPKELGLVAVILAQSRMAMNRPEDDLSAYPRDDGRKIAGAVMDDSNLRALQQARVRPAAEIVCLSADVRLRQLAPAACHALDLELVALATGALKVEAIRITDLATQESIDIIDLPPILCRIPSQPSNHR